MLISPLPDSPKEKSQQEMISYLESFLIRTEKELERFDRKKCVTKLKSEQEAINKFEKNIKSFQEYVRDEIIELQP